MLKKLPSLTSDYRSLILNGEYYADKTRYIEILENQNFRYLFYMRPRRFGKSLHLSMLEYYYGIQYEHEFEKLFGAQYIGNHPTPLKNRYYILRFDFSAIPTDSAFEIKKSFNDKLKVGIREFNRNYKILHNDELTAVLSQDNPSAIILEFLSVVSQNREVKIYLLIDEYDHFTNELFSFDEAVFRDIVLGNGWVRKFYEAVKQFMGMGIIDRFFATGVTPVTLDSMTSGFNVARNITLLETYNEMTGFTESEVENLLMSLPGLEEGKKIQELISILRIWYNGSLFSLKANEKLYNPQMIISFLASYLQGGDFPRDMSDPSVISDYSKIDKILTKLEDSEYNRLIEEVYVNETVTDDITIQFNTELPFTKKDAVSLLFYNGLLTFRNEEFGAINYIIPNYVIKNLYWEYLRAVYESRYGLKYDFNRLTEAYKEMAISGKIEKLAAYISAVLEKSDNRDFINFNESNLKTLFISLLSMNKMFRIKSEFSAVKGYADILLLPAEGHKSEYSFLLELKYLTQKRAGEENNIVKKGLMQLKDYKDSEECNSILNLKTFLILFSGRSKYKIIEGA